MLDDNIINTTYIRDKLDISSDLKSKCSLCVNLKDYEKCIKCNQIKGKTKIESKKCECGGSCKNGKCDKFIKKEDGFPNRCSNCFDKIDKFCKLCLKCSKEEILKKIKIEVNITWKCQYCQIDNKINKEVCQFCKKYKNLDDFRSQSQVPIKPKDNNQIKEDYILKPEFQLTCLICKKDPSLYTSIYCQTCQTSLKKNPANNFILKCLNCSKNISNDSIYCNSCLDEKNSKKKNFENPKDYNYKIPIIGNKQTLDRYNNNQSTPTNKQKNEKLNDGNESFRKNQQAAVNNNVSNSSNFNTKKDDEKKIFI